MIAPKKHGHTWVRTQDTTILKKLKCEHGGDMAKQKFLFSIYRSINLGCIDMRGTDVYIGVFLYFSIFPSLFLYILLDPKVAF